MKSISKLKFFAVVILFCFFTNVEGQNFYNLKSKTLTTQEGHVYPGKIEVANKEEVFFQLLTLPADFNSCKLTSPNLDKVYNITPSTQGRIQYWNPIPDRKSCGVRIRPITTEDEGRWKLEATNANNIKFFSFIEIKVLEREIPDPTFYVREGERAEINITSRADYCDVKRLSALGPNTIYENCFVNITSMPRSLSGIWYTQAGIRGQVKDVQMRPKIVISKEEFYVGYNYTLPKINLYCNLQNTKNLTFRYCRFIRGDQQISLNLKEGLSDGKYSYYGTGLRHGDCGLTIETPEASDLTIWKCQIGLIFHGTNFNTSQTRDSVIYVPRDRFDKSYIREEEKDINIFATVDQPLNLVCQAEYPLKYCWLQQPNGTVYDVSRKQDSNVMRSDGSLSSGECQLTILKSMINDTGMWKCFMSPKDRLGLEIVRNLYVRVAKTAMVAEKQEVSATLGSKTTLKCTVTDVTRSLEYCRFSTPDGRGFSFDESVTEKNPLDNQYWFEGKLENGDCQVTIKKVTENHLGEWVCAGKLLDTNELDLYDRINLRISGGTQSDEDFSTASIALISVLGAGAIILILIVIVFIFKSGKRRRALVRQNDNISITSEDSQNVIFSLAMNANTQQNQSSDRVSTRSLNSQDLIFVEENVESMEMNVIRNLNENENSERTENESHKEENVM